MRSCGKNGRAGQATDNNRKQHMRFTCWVSKATETLKIYEARF
jgi:hypothetical protein